MKKIVIFDMDGTLIDSAKDITISINYVRRHHYGMEDLTESFVVDAINATKRNLAQLFYNTNQYEDKDKNLFEEHYHEQCIKNVRPYDHIYDILDYLHTQGCFLGVATNAPSLFAKRMLSHLHLSNYFTHIIGADNVHTPKPHPQMIQMHLNHHAYNPHYDRAWMIGDNDKDMDAARSANITGVFATWGFSQEGRGDYCAQNPMELAKIILED